MKMVRSQLGVEIMKMNCFTTVKDPIELDIAHDHQDAGWAQ